ncbi:hypothetical protein [Polyangium sp. 6x1]|uniref:hypothetical protein n=1 Tax=Polyangium sp. 6x1 TaxID=3042689 RepID=UPI002482214A|nr:hypothetical protein [Polyangium sp. 6x1]MDI1446199.1 hypothetical protein [Polyangium sp. 6x1]
MTRRLSLLSTASLVISALVMAFGCSCGDRTTNPEAAASASAPVATAPAPPSPSSAAPPLEPPAPTVRPTPAWLDPALKQPVRPARPEAATCVSEVDVDDLVQSSQAAMEKNEPQRITIQAFSLHGMGCPCYEQMGFAHHAILPHTVRGLPGSSGLPPRVHGGSFTLTGYFTGRRINTYEWYAAQGVSDATPEEGADYASPYLEFVIEGWCFHPPKPDPDWDKLFAESNAEMRRRGVPFCKVESPCANRPEPATLPTGPCSRDLILQKARLLDNRDLLAQWDAAAVRYRNGFPRAPKGLPREVVSLDVWRDADGAALGRKHGAKSFEHLGSSETWFLTFENAERAIDAMPGLLCDPDVAGASLNSTTP